MRATGVRRRQTRLFPPSSLDLRFAETKSLIDTVSGLNLITFTRASSGTYFDATGTLRRATTNLLLRSEEFDDASWTKVRASVSANTITAPNGMLTADTGVEDASASTTHNPLIQDATIVANGVYTASLYVRAKERSRGAIWFSSTDSANYVSGDFNLNTGTITATNGGTGSGALAAITNVGGGWYRVSISGSIGGSLTTGRLVLRMADANGSIVYTGDGTSGIYIWGAQLEQSFTVGEYIPTTSTINSAPRFDHNPITGESLGLLVEEQRTNSIRNNTMQGAVAGTPGTAPTNWPITSTGLGITREIVGIGTEDGITYIDIKYSGTATSASNISIQFEANAQTVASQGQIWTLSFYARLVAGSFANISFTPFINSYTAAGAFDASSTSVVNIFSPPTSAALKTQKFSSTGTLSSATTARVNGGLFSGISSGASIDFTLRIGLPQLELGAFATSVIPTTTAAATRSADVVSITGTNFSSWYRQDEGTVFASASVTTPSYSAGVLWDIGAGGAFGSTAYCVWNGSQWTLNPLTAPLNLFSAVASSALSANASALQLNNSVIAANGLLGSVDLSCSLPSSPTTLSIGKAGWASGNFFNGTIRRLSYWPARLPDATLQALTR